MKARVISAAVALVILFTVIFLYKTVAVNIIAALVIAVMTHEFLHAVGAVKSKVFTAVTVVFAASSAFVFYIRDIYTIFLVCFVYVLFCGGGLLVKYEHLDIGSMMSGVGAALFIPFPLLALLAIRREYFDKPELLLVTCMVFCSAWATDTGAFFVGSAIGKHKLIPSVSPKKTVEGVFGGVALNAVVTLLLGYIFSLILKNDQGFGGVNYVNMLIIAIPASALAVAGDLFASLIKRQCNIKDFSKLIPGHGGMLDRFDSLIAVAPFIFLMLRWLPVVR